jgi:ribosomal protein S27E
LSVPLSVFNLRNYIGYSTLLIILVILALIAIVIIVGLAYNRNKEIKELEALVERMKTDRGTDKGGPRKVIKEASGAGAPAAPSAKSGPGLPSAPGPLAPAGPTAGKIQKGDAPKKKEAVKVKCPQCKTQQVVSIDKRPAEVPCKECGVTLLIPEKK